MKPSVGQVGGILAVLVLTTQASGQAASIEQWRDCWLGLEKVRDAMQEWRRSAPKTSLSPSGDPALVASDERVRQHPISNYEEQRPGPKKGTVVRVPRVLLTGVKRGVGDSAREGTYLLQPDPSPTGGNQWTCAFVTGPHPETARPTAADNLGPADAECLDTFAERVEARLHYVESFPLPDATADFMQAAKDLQRAVKQQPGAGACAAGLGEPYTQAAQEIRKRDPGGRSGDSAPGAGPGAQAPR